MVEYDVEVEWVGAGPWVSCVEGSVMNLRSFMYKGKRESPCVPALRRPQCPCVPLTFVEPPVTGRGRDPGVTGSPRRNLGTEDVPYLSSSCLLVPGPHLRVDVVGLDPPPDLGPRHPGVQEGTRVSGSWSGRSIGTIVPPFGYGRPGGPSACGQVHVATGKTPPRTRRCETPR